MDLADHFRIILQNWWRILIAAVLVAVAVYVIVDNQQKVYTASTTMSVSSGIANTGAVPAQTEEVFLGTTYAELATTRPVVASAVRSAKLPISVDTAQSRVSASADTNTGFVTITADGPNPHDAAALARNLATSLEATVSRQQDAETAKDLASVNAEIAAVEAQLATLPAGSPQAQALEVRYTALLEAATTRQTQPRDSVAVVAPAQIPTQPSSPRPGRDSALGFIVALILTAELFVAITVIGDRFPRGLDAEAVAEAIGLPVLASIPRGIGGPTVEAFRTLRTTVAALPEQHRPQSLAIVSSHPNAGKSFVSINLAEATAAQGAGVLLIDADLRRPAVHQRLGIPQQPGLTDVLAGTDLNAALHSVPLDPQYAVTEPRRILVLPSGTAVPDPTAVLSTDIVGVIRSRVDGAPRQFIVDTPPANLFGDALAVVTHCDAAIIVVDTRRGGLRATRNTIRSLRRSGVHVLGVVLNRVTTSRRRRYYGYQYRSSETPETPPAGEPDRRRSSVRTGSSGRDADSTSASVRGRRARHDEPTSWRATPPGTS